MCHPVQVIEYIFLCPEIEDRREYCFSPVCHSVILQFCHSVLLSETLTLLITYEQWVLELWYFTWTFLVRRPFRGYHYVLPCDHNLGVWPFFKNFNLANTFWTVSALALLYDMSISSDNTGILVTTAIFGIGQYREHFCFTNKSCLVCSPLDYYFLNIYFKYCSMNDLWSLLSYNEFHAFIYISMKNVLKQWLLSYKRTSSWQIWFSTGFLLFSGG